MNDVTGNACPARYRPSETNLDSTFDFGFSSEEDTEYAQNCDEALLDDVSDQASAISHSESESSDIAINKAFSDAEEMWESSDEEDNTVMATEEIVRNAQSIMFGLSAFLNFFQLAFCVSERAMFILLQFLRHLLFHLSSIIPGNGVLQSYVLTFRDRSIPFERF